jgi:hypothetical protein
MPSTRPQRDSLLRDHGNSTNFPREKARIPRGNRVFSRPLANLIMPDALVANCVAAWIEPLPYTISENMPSMARIPNATRLVPSVTASDRENKHPRGHSTIILQKRLMFHASVIRSSHSFPSNLLWTFQNTVITLWKSFNRFITNRKRHFRAYGAAFSEGFLVFRTSSRYLIAAYFPVPIVLYKRSQLSHVRTRTLRTVLSRAICLDRK